MRTALATLILASLVGCGSPHRAGIDAKGSGDIEYMDAACIGLQCRVVDCVSQGKPRTSVSGTAFAPNGTLALYGVTVYIPNLDPGTFEPGVHCDRCDPNLPGEPITRALSDEAGHFKLEDIPADTEMTLILTVGKWRRKVLIPAVPACTETALTPAQTSLPKNKAQGELPQIAITTGGCDALECLVRKLGVSDSEFTNDTGTGHVHLYSGSGGATRLGNNAVFSAAGTLWSSLEQLKKYDLLMMSCECSQNADAKPQASMDAVKAYADLGGRAFMSHYHNVWIAGDTRVGQETHKPAVWPSIATCNIDQSNSGDDIIDQINNPKGDSFANWMLNVQGSTTLGNISIEESRQTCASIDPTKAERWVYKTEGSTDYPQNFQFTTPNEALPEDRCGKVVFSDMHVASGSFSSDPFPSGCSASPMTPQEKAIAFMFFDIASCIEIIN